MELGSACRLDQMVGDISDVLDELHSLRAEVAELREYRRQYFELLDESVKRGQNDCANLVLLMLRGQLVPRLEQP